MNWLYTLPLKYWQQWIAHLLVGLILCYALRKQPRLAIGVILSIAILKEVLDYYCHGHFDLVDCLFTALPIFLLIYKKY